MLRLHARLTREMDAEMRARHGISLSAYVFAGVLVGLVTVSQVLTPRLAPPRFTRWTGQGQVDLDAFGMGAQATIFAPLRRALQRARRDALRIIGVTLGAAALGAVVAIPFGWPLPAFALLAILAALLLLVLAIAILLAVLALLLLFVGHFTTPASAAGMPSCRGTGSTRGQEREFRHCDGPWPRRGRRAAH